MSGAFDQRGKAYCHSQHRFLSHLVEDGAAMFIRYGHKKWASFVAALQPLVLCGMLSVGALAQSTPPPKPSGNVNIHQVQIAFIGSGAMGGGTLYFQGRSYPFKLGGLAIGGSGYRRSTPPEASTISAVCRILRAFTVKRASDLRWASRAKVRCGCKTPTAFICV